MVRLLIALALVAVALLVARVLSARRTSDAPATARWPVPIQLDRADFARPEAPWLVAVFSSVTCVTCAKSVAQAAALASAEVSVQDIEVEARGDLHRRYGVEAVPLVLIADGEGVVQASFVGPTTATDLWAAMASVRE